MHTLPEGPAVGVVGGGVLGMTLALRLRTAGCRVTILEGAAAAGGLAAPQDVGGFTWDRFYHVILKSDAHLLALLGELGFAERIAWAYARTGFFTDGQLLSLSSNLDFLRFPPLSLLDKARLAGTILYAARLRDWRRLEAIPATDWLRRLSGRRTFERLWQPLLCAKLGQNYRLASAAFIWAIIARMYAARRSGLKREMFGHVDGGYAPVLQRFAEHLTALGVELCCGRGVHRVHDDGGAVRVTLADGTHRDFDRVIVTTPASRVPALCPQLSDAEQQRLSRVVYQGVVCASVLLREPLAGYYITNITDGDTPFTAVIEMTALVDRARFGGHALVYLPRYLAQDDPFWERSDAEIEAAFLEGLARMYPRFRREHVLAFRVSRAREVLALSTLHYSERAMPGLGTSLPNVYMVNSAQIASGTLNLNETVALANAQAAILASQFSASVDVVVNV